jgi:hypothetical protein
MQLDNMYLRCSEPEYICSEKCRLAAEEIDGPVLVEVKKHTLPRTCDCQPICEITNTQIRALAPQRSHVFNHVCTQDTSLCFNALNGLPGPYIKWFLEKTGAFPLSFAACTSLLLPARAFKLYSRACVRALTTTRHCTFGSAYNHTKRSHAHAGHDGLNNILAAYSDKSAYSQVFDPYSQSKAAQHDISEIQLL